MLHVYPVSHPDDQSVGNSGRQLGEEVHRAVCVGGNKANAPTG